MATVTVAVPDTPEFRAAVEQAERDGERVEVVYNGAGDAFIRCGIATATVSVRTPNAWQKQLAEMRAEREQPAPPAKPTTRPPVWRSLDD